MAAIKNIIKKIKATAITFFKAFTKKEVYIPAIIILGLAFLVFAYYLIWLLPFDEVLYSKIGEDYEKYKEMVNKRRMTYATIIGGIGAFVLLVVHIIRTVKFSEQVKEERRANISSLTLDQYVKAVDQLGRNDNIAVRLGGIYSLEQIMNSKEEDVIENYHDVIIELLCAYVRENTYFNQKDYKTNKEAYEKDPKTDIQAILTVLGRRKNFENEKVEIKLYLTNLYNCSLVKANMKKALLWDVLLDDSNLWGIHLENARLERSHLEKVKVWGIYLENADLSNADLQNIILAKSGCKEDETKEDIINFIKELEKAKEVKGIKLDDNIMEIIEEEEEFKELLKRIKGEVKN